MKEHTTFCRLSFKASSKTHSYTATTSIGNFHKNTHKKTNGTRKNIGNLTSYKETLLSTRIVLLIQISYTVQPNSRKIQEQPPIYQIFNLDQ